MRYKLPTTDDVACAAAHFTSGRLKTSYKLKRLDIGPFQGLGIFQSLSILPVEVLETLFDPALIHGKQLTTTQEKSKLQLGGLGSSGTSAGKYEGFGSSPVDKKESIKDKMINMFTKFLNPPNETEEIIRSALTSSTGDYTPVSIVSKSTQYVHPNLSPTAKSTAKAKVHVPGKAAGGWESEDEVSPTRDPQGSQSGRTSSIVSTDSLEKIDSLSLESSDERRLVKEFCNLPRVPLSWSEIEVVGSRAVSMSIVDVLKAINDILTSSSDSPIPEGFASNIQSTETASASDVKQIRALFIVEWFLHTDHISPAIISQILHTNLQKLSAANNKVCPALGIKAKKVRLILGKLVTPDKKNATLN
uniref:Uncharacterized protein n=1 Tax=Timema bartmani TaxID=61472 RepID=A0A7R9HZF5_9NEOP|nr:unnamed protein product [Timema bartmani]